MAILEKVEKEEEVLQWKEDEEVLLLHHQHMMSCICLTVLLVLPLGVSN
ncbi:hypothetical protein Leryth_019978 [Lithospermum erythrorhizon]|nr:hypothetical protein Leryth_019978 [Lithospermum erythrorhizon]